MPYCSILECKNASNTKNLKNGGISYHRFPKKPDLKEKWIEATGRVNWMPTPSSTICSEHFEEDNILVSNKGNRYIKPSSIPTLKIVKVYSQTEGHSNTNANNYKVEIQEQMICSQTENTLNDSCPKLDYNVGHMPKTGKIQKYLRFCEEKIKNAHLKVLRLQARNRRLTKKMSNMIPMPIKSEVKFTMKQENLEHVNSSSLEICRGCLLTGCKLFSITKNKLALSFKRVSGKDVFEDSMLPTSLCAECAQRLINFQKFRFKVRRADKVMKKILASNNELTPQSVESIDRIKYGFQSNIVHGSMEVNLCDGCSNCEDNRSEVDEANSSVLNVEIEVKKEFSNEIKEIYEVEFENQFNENLKPNDTNDQHSKEITHISDQKCNMSGTSLTNTLSEIKLEKESFTRENCGSDVDLGDSVDRYSSDDSSPPAPKKPKWHSIKLKEPKRSPKQSVIMIKDMSQAKIVKIRQRFPDAPKKSFFTITNLNFDQQVAEFEKRQNTVKFKLSVYKCLQCYRGFADEDSYERHMLRHTNKWGNYECSVCKLHFKNRIRLRNHNVAFHIQRFCCNVCPFVTTHLHTAGLHEKWHKGIKYKCPICQEEFEKLTTLMSHRRLKHPSDYVCELCGYSFVSEKGIHQHKRLKHRFEQCEVPENGPNCEVCNVKFISEEAFKTHLNVSSRHCDAGNKPKHNEPKRQWKRSEMFLENCKKFDQPMPCEQCGVQLEDARAYHSHFRRAHPDKNRTNYPTIKAPCMCEHCGKIFQSITQLRDHNYTHSGVRAFACDSCDKRFATRLRLVAHLRSHLAAHERPPITAHACPICEKSFTSKGNRQRHMAIHTGLRPFKCEVCAKCFKDAADKRAHVDHVHLKKPWPRRNRPSRAMARATPE